MISTKEASRRQCNAFEFWERKKIPSLKTSPVPRLGDDVLLFCKSEGVFDKGFHERWQPEKKIKTRSTKTENNLPVLILYIESINNHYFFTSKDIKNKFIRNIQTVLKFLRGHNCIINLTIKIRLKHMQ